MSERDLSADIAACEAATKGEWCAVGPCNHDEFPYFIAIGMNVIGKFRTEADADAAALQHNNMPYWLGEVQRLRAAIESSYATLKFELSEANATIERQAATLRTLAEEKDAEIERLKAELEPLKKSEAFQRWQADYRDEVNKPIPVEDAAP